MNGGKPFPAQAWPICGVCGTPVEKVSVFYDPEKRKQIFEARCHGAVERTSLSDFDLDFLILGEGIRAGIAFKDRRIRSEKRLGAQGL